MKRVCETSSEIVLPEDCLLCILPHLVDCGVVSPRKLLGWYSITKRTYQIWKDRGEMSKLFSTVHEKSKEIFMKEKHGYNLENVFYTLSLNKMFVMAEMIWKEIIIPLDISEITEDKLIWGFTSRPPKEQLTFNELFGSHREYLSQNDIACIRLLSQYLRMNYGWEIPKEDMDYSYTTTARVYIKPVGENRNVFEQ